MSEPNWDALACAVRRRRLSLDLSQERLVKRGGPSHQTVRNIERGLPAEYRATTYRNLDRALDWRHGTAEKVLNGTATEEETMGTIEPRPDGARPSDRDTDRQRYAASLDDLTGRLNASLAAGALTAGDFYRYRIELEKLRLRFVGGDAARVVEILPELP